MKQWLMIGGGLVLLALFVLPDLGIGAGQLFGFLMLLLCPLLHLFMMRSGSHGHGHGGSQTPGPPASGTPALRVPEGEESAGPSR